MLCIINDSKYGRLNDKMKQNYCILYGYGDYRKYALCNNLSFHRHWLDILNAYFVIQRLNVRKKIDYYYFNLINIKVELNEFFKLINPTSISIFNLCSLMHIKIVLFCVDYICKWKIHGIPFEKLLLNRWTKFNVDVLYNVGCIMNHTLILHLYSHVHIRKIKIWKITYFKNLHQICGLHHVINTCKYCIIEMRIAWFPGPAMLRVTRARWIRAKSPWIFGAYVIMLCEY